MHFNFWTISTLAVVILLYILFLCIVFYTYPKATTYQQTFDEASAIDPRITALTFKKNDDGTYLVGTYTEDGFKITNESKPIDILGSAYVDVYNKGLEYTDSGYTVYPFQNEIKCPNNFSGNDCKINDMCNDENGKIKGVTLEIFNALNLYNNNFETQTISTRDITYHKRLRIKCLEGTNYQIQNCPENKLLNSALECEEYDICEDHLDSYRHTYATSKNDIPLLENEYYICKNNKSVKQTCADDSVFSIANNACIVKSVCFNKGDATLPIENSDSTYIQCLNDSGNIITCPNGLITIGDKIKCLDPDCGKITYKKYTYSEWPFKYYDCVTDPINPKTIECDDTIQAPQIEFAMNDYINFVFTPNQIIPKKVLDIESKTCIDVDDPTIYYTDTPIIIMDNNLIKSAPFNIKTNQFNCNTEYKLDISNSNINIVNSKNEITDKAFLTGVCIDELNTNVNIPFIVNSDTMKNNIIVDATANVEKLKNVWVSFEPIIDDDDPESQKANYVLYQAPDDAQKILKDGTVMKESEYPGPIITEQEVLTNFKSFNYPILSSFEVKVVTEIDNTQQKYYILLPNKPYSFNYIVDDTDPENIQTETHVMTNDGLIYILDCPPNINVEGFTFSALDILNETNFDSKYFIVQKLYSIN